MDNVILNEIYNCYLVVQRNKIQQFFKTNIL